MKNQHEHYMNIAIKLALRGKGLTSPNPMVGSVIVKDGKIIGKGYHKKAGTEHAEINAISNAKDMAYDGELYVNLEPCCHFGRTGPCVDAIIKSGIKKVVVGMTDPNPKVSGKGILRLRKAGIVVIHGILEEKCRKINEVFIKYIKTKMPYVILKIAESLDGKIATKSGDSRWISNEKSRRLVHKTRSEVDGVLVGIDTVIADNPLLTVRDFKKAHIQPKSIILDSKLRIPASSILLKSKDLSDIIICTTKQAKEAAITQFKNMGANVLIVDDISGKVDIKKLLSKLADLNITSILVEGGSKVNAAFVESGFIDKIMVFICPVIIGGEDAVTAVSGTGFNSVKTSLKLSNVKYRRIDDNILIEGDVRKVINGRISVI